MSHKFKVPFRLEMKLTDAIEMFCDKTGRVRSAYNERIHQALVEKYNDFPDLKWMENPNSRDHVNIIFDDPNRAMLFKLAHGGS